MSSNSISRAAIFVLLASSSSVAQETSIRFYAVAPHSRVTPPHTAIAVNPGEIFYFDRVNNPNGITDPAMQKAIANSNTLLSGTVVKRKNVEGCWTYDWTTTALSRESSNVVIYRPGDVSVFCDAPPPADPQNPPPQDPNQVATLYVVIPTRAIWVQINGFRGDLNDPARKSSGSLQPIPPCWHDEASSPAAQPATGTQPCDVNANRIRHAFYRSGWFYNRLTAPGVWTGSFTIAPQVVQNVGQTLTEDIRFYGSSSAGPGWLGLSGVFEKGASVTSNLNSLIGALTYDLPLSKSPWWAYSETPNNQGIGIRPSALLFSSGEEYAPTRTKGLNGVHEPKDLNLVEGIYYKQPISVTAFRYPSFLTLFPMLGAEGGRHLIHYQPGESAQFFRKVVGMDASIRYPFLKAPNFTSTKGATIDYTLRERFLSSFEPYTDAASPITPILSRQRRSYSRIALT